MADLSLSPAPTAAVPAPAPVAPRPSGASPGVGAPDPEDDKVTEPTRTGSNSPKATVAGAAPPSETLGSGLIAGGLLDGNEGDTVSATSIGQSLRPLPTVTQTGALPSATGPSLLDNVSHMAEECAAPGQRCRSTVLATTGYTLGSIGRSHLNLDILGLIVSWSDIGDRGSHLVVPSS
jgi:hypothetical protein